MFVGRINKPWFLFKILFFILILSFGVFVVFKKDFIMENFCDCVPCDLKEVRSEDDIFGKFVDSFCACPICD